MEIMINGYYIYIYRDIISYLIIMSMKFTINGFPYTFALNTKMWPNLCKSATFYRYFTMAGGCVIWMGAGVTYFRLPANN